MNARISTLIIFVLAFLPYPSTVVAQLKVYGRVEYFDSLSESYQPARNILIELEGDWYWRGDPQMHSNERGEFSFNVEKPGWPHNIWHGDWDNVNIEAYAETDNLLDIKEHWLAFYSYSAESPETDDVPLEGEREIILRIGGPNNNSVDSTRSTAETANAIMAHQEILAFINKLKELGFPHDAFDEKDFIIPAAGFPGMRSYYNHVTGNINIVFEESNFGEGLELPGLGYSWANLKGSVDPYVNYDDFKLMLRHEYSHAMHDEVTGWGILAGLNMPIDHNATMETNEHVAFTEGFATFLPLISLEPIKHRYEAARTVLPRSAAIPFSAQNGWEMEGHVTGFLWDLVDRNRAEEYRELPTATVNGAVPIPRELADRIIWTEELEEIDSRNLPRVIDIVCEYDGLAPVDTIDEFVEYYVKRYPEQLHQVKAVAWHRWMSGWSLPPESGPWFDASLRLTREDGTKIALSGTVREWEEVDRPLVRVELHHQTANGNWTFYAGTHRFVSDWEGDRSAFEISVDLGGNTAEGGFPTGLTSLKAGDQLWLVLTDDMIPRVYRLDIPAPGAETVLNIRDLRPERGDPGYDLPGGSDIAGSSEALKSIDWQNVEKAKGAIRRVGAGGDSEPADIDEIIRASLKRLVELIRGDDEELEKLYTYLETANEVLGNPEIRDMASPKTRADILEAIESALGQAESSGASQAPREFLGYSREFVRQMRNASQQRLADLQAAQQEMRNAALKIDPMLVHDGLRAELRTIVDGLDARVAKIREESAGPNVEANDRRDPTVQTLATIQIGVLSGGNFPVALENSAISIRDEQGKSIVLESQTNGAFQTDLPWGRYQLQVSSPGYYPLSTNLEVDANAVSHDVYLSRFIPDRGETLQGISVASGNSAAGDVSSKPVDNARTPNRTIRIQGYVLARANESAKYQAISGASVKACDRDGKTLAEATSGDNGSFSLNVSAGDLQLTATAQGYPDSVHKLKASADVDRLVFRLVDESSAKGSVIPETLPEPEKPRKSSSDFASKPAPTKPSPSVRKIKVVTFVVDSRGMTGIPDVESKWSDVSNSQSESQEAEAVSDASGRVVLELTPGRYQVELLPRHPGYDSATSWIDIVPGKEPPYLKLSQTAAAKGNYPPPANEASILSGIVLTRAPDSRNRFIALPDSKLVAISDSGERQEITVESNGQFSQVMPAGKYRLEVDPPDPYQERVVELNSAPNAAPAYIVISRKPDVMPPAQERHGDSDSPDLAKRRRPDSRREATEKLVTPATKPQIKPPAAPTKTPVAAKAKIRLHIVHIPGGEFGDEPIPVANVKIRAYAPGGPGEASGQTDSDGKATIELDIGKVYEILTNHDAYRQSVQSIRPDRDQDLRIELKSK